MRTSAARSRLPACLAAAACLVLLGAGAKDSLVHLTSRPWITLDPALAYDSVSFIVTGNLYEPLIAPKSLDKPDEFLPFLAGEVPSLENGLLSPDRLSYAFPIRKGVRFHSGDLLTPEDVRYSLLRYMLLDSPGGPSALLLKPLLGVYGTRDASGKLVVDFAEAERAVRVEGERVVLRLKRPSASFLKILASLPVVVCKRWALERGDWDGTEAGLRRLNGRLYASSPLHAATNGTGPFLGARVAADRSALAFERFPGYWRKPAALGRVLLRVVPGAAVRMAMLENADADGSYLDERDFEAARQLAGVRVEEAVPNSSLGEVLFFTFDVEPDPAYTGSGALDGDGIPRDFFRDPRVRRGFAFALDYEAYLARGLAGRGRRQASPIPELLLPDQGGAPYRHDPERAAKELKAAFGGKLWDKGFTLTLAYSPSNGARLALAELLQKGLAAINPRFRVRLKALGSEALYAEAERHRLPLFIAGYYADYPDPQAFAFGMLHSSGYYPRAQRYAEPRLDALVERAEEASDPKERRGLYLQAAALAAAELPHITTYAPLPFRAERAEVRDADSSGNVSNLRLNGFPYFYGLSKE